MITKVRLYGELGKKWGRYFELDISHPQEAIKLIDAGKPGFRNAYREMPGYAFRVRVGKYDIGEDGLTTFHGGRTISITPVLEGAASGKSIGLAILGVVLFAVDVLFIHTGYLALFGLSLTLSGVAGLLAPTPKTAIDNEPSKNKPSFQFSGPVNTVQAGGPVPVLYGRLWIGSAVISVGVFSKDITQGSNPSDDDPSVPHGSGGTGTSNTGPGTAGTPAWWSHDHSIG